MPLHFSVDGANAIFAINANYDYSYLDVNDNYKLGILPFKSSGTRDIIRGLEFCKI